MDKEENIKNTFILIWVVDILIKILFISYFKKELKNKHKIIKNIKDIKKSKYTEIVELKKINIIFFNNKEKLNIPNDEEKDIDVVET